MRTRQRGELPNDLAQAQARFQAWRQRPQRERRIPQPLWDLAVQLVASHGLARTAAALALDYYSLKRHVADASQPTPSDAPAFVEVPAPLVLARQARLELDNGAGATLRLQLLGYDAADLQALLHRFWDAP